MEKQMKPNQTITLYESNVTGNQFNSGAYSYYTFDIDNSLNNYLVIRIKTKSVTANELDHWVYICCETVGGAPYEQESFVLDVSKNGVAWLKVGDEAKEYLDGIDYYIWDELTVPQAVRHFNKYKTVYTPSNLYCLEQDLYSN